LKKLWLLAAGIVLFGAVAMGLIALAPAGDPVTAPPAPPEAAPAPSAAASLPRALPTGVPVQPGPPAPPNVYGPAAPEPPPGSWEAVAPVARPSSMGPAGGALGRGLNEIRDQISACFDEYAQARHGQEKLTQTQDYQPMPDYGTTVLMLEVETLNGRVRIHDAPVETRGGASDGLIACAQRVLRGQVFEAPGVPGGERHRVLHPLLP
jgi:hypothetical protein